MRIDTGREEGRMERYAGVSLAYAERELTELEKAGLNPEELEWMAADERREVLEGAGLNPAEYDF